MWPLTRCVVLTDYIPRSEPMPTYPIKIPASLLLKMPVRFCTIRLLCVKPENEGDRPSKAKRNPSWLSASPIPRRCGRNTRSAGMGESHARWKSRRGRLCGINLPSLRSPSVGSSFAIQQATTSPSPCCVPIKVLRLSTS